MKAFFYSALALLLAACSTSPAHELDISAQVKMENTKAHFLLPGTRLSVIPPQQFTFDRDLMRFTKPDSAIIMFIDLAGHNFTEDKNKFIDSLHIMEEQGISIYFKKEFKIGTYDAYLVYAPSPDKKTEQIFLLMGNQNNTVIGAAQVLKNNAPLRNQLVKSLLSIYLDEKLVVDYSSLEVYTIDHASTDFKYLTHQSQFAVYTTIEGNNVMQNPFANYAMTMTMPAMTPEQKKTYSFTLMENLKNNGISIQNILHQGPTTINGMPSYEIVAAGQYRGKNNQFYQLVTGDYYKTVVFTGIAYDSVDNYIQQYRAMGASIQMKGVE